MPGGTLLLADWLGRNRVFPWQVPTSIFASQHPRPVERRALPAQAGNSLSTDLSGDTVQFGETRSWGLELEAKADITTNLSATASYTYTDAKITDDSVASRVGTRIDGVPYHMANLWADYRLAALGLPKVAVGGGAQ